MRNHAADLSDMDSDWNSRNKGASLPLVAKREIEDGIKDNRKKTRRAITSCGHSTCWMDKLAVVDAAL